jgi:hypothetical protein
MKIAKKGVGFDWERNAGKGEREVMVTVRAVWG